jgi:antitoxin CptB
MRELDVLLERWLDTRWADADSELRAAFERLLATEDDVLWAWAIGRERPADPDIARVLDQAVDVSSR